MLRNHSGWAWRRFVAFLLLFLFCHGPTLRGAPLIGVPPLRPVIPTSPPPPVYQPPANYMISGYVYDDSTGSGVKLSGEWGIYDAKMTLDEYAAGSSTLIALFTTFTNSAGYYSFGNLATGTSDSYTLIEAQPAGYATTLNTVGTFLSATGGTLAAPLGASNGTLSPPDAITGIVLPSPTGAFAPSATGVYSAVNYNFGEIAQTVSSGGAGVGKPPIRPGVREAAARPLVPA